MFGTWAAKKLLQAHPMLPFETAEPRTLKIGRVENKAEGNEQKMTSREAPLLHGGMHHTSGVLNGGFKHVVINGAQARY